MPQEHDEAPFLLRVILAVLCGYWLWVFFPPMQQLHLVTGSHAFIPVLIILVLAQMAPYFWIRLVIGVIASEGFVWYYYHASPHLTIFDVFGLEVQQLGTLFTSHQLADPLQTNLFLFAVCVIYWLINYASQRPRLWLFYNGLGILVLAIVAGNTKVHPNGSLVAICVIALVVMGLSFYAKLQWRAAGPRRSFGRFLAPLSLFLVVCTGFAWLLPKAPAVWADPFHSGGPASRLLGNGPGTGNEKFIGYQESNNHLGGPFQMDHTPVMEVTTPQPTYLRGKVYDTYTGKGWTATPHFQQIVPPSGHVDTTGLYGPGQVPTKTIQQTIHIIGGLSHTSAVFGGYAVTNVQLTHGKSSAPTNVDPNTLNVFANWNQPGNQYVVKSLELKDPANLLSRQAPLPKNLNKRRSVYPTALIGEYLQLPSELPSRVKTLTQQVVAGDTTEYQMIQSIENYLQLNETYQTQGIPTPTGRQDYVSQFLFQSHKGYCNNFSSAMAVMLRSIDIPTRWVTGFTSGSFDSANPGKNMDNYLIEESDAHSWVEVYFPNVGWVPFDPTPNFQFDYIQSSPQSGSTQSTPPTTKHSKPPHTKSPTPSAVAASFDWTGLLHWVLYCLAALVVLFGIALILFRRRLQLAWHLRAWSGGKQSLLSRGFHQLFHLLKREGMLPSANVTVRELAPLAKRYDLDGKDYQHLVKTVETTWYSKEPAAPEDLQRVHRTWSTWIRRILGR